MKRHYFLLWLIVSMVFCVGLTTAKADIGLTITLDRPLHFTAPDGSDVGLPAASYRIEQAGESGLRLLKEGAPPIEIQATKISHDESVTSPTAVAVMEEGQDDAVHLLLVLPGGQALDAVGLFSDVRSRAMLSALRPVQVQSAVNQFMATPQPSTPSPQQGVSPNAIVRVPQAQPTSPPASAVTKGKRVLWSYLQMNHPDIVASALANVQTGKLPRAFLAAFGSPAEVNELLRTNWSAEVAKLNTPQAAGGVTTRGITDASKAQSNLGTVAGNLAPSLAARLSPAVALNVVQPPVSLGSAWSGQRPTTTITVTAPADGFIRAELDLNATRQRFRIVEAKTYTGEVNNGQPVGAQTVKGGDYNDIRLSASDPSKHISMAGSVAINVRAGQRVDITVGFEPDSIVGPPVGNYEVMLEVGSNVPTWRRSIPIRARCEGINFGVIVYAEQGNILTIADEATDVRIVANNATATPVAATFTATQLPPGVAMDPLSVVIPPQSALIYILKFHVNHTAQDGNNQPVVVRLNYANQSRLINFTMSLFHTFIFMQPAGETMAEGTGLGIRWAKLSMWDDGHWWWGIDTMNLAPGGDIDPFRSRNFTTTLTFNANKAVSDTIDAHVGPMTSNQYYDRTNFSTWLRDYYLNAAEGGVTVEVKKK